MPHQYMREKLEDKWGFLTLQDKILEIAVYIDGFCRQNDIDYCLMGGSALGAKRHGGFIPWDDDLDIFMTPAQYEKFRECFLASGNCEKFYLQEWGAVDGLVTISKIRMNNTTYIENEFTNWNIHQGIYVDIFILHTCPKNKLSQMHQCLWAKYVIMKGLAIRGYNRRGGFLGFALKVMKHLPAKMWVKHGLKQVYKYRDKDTGLYCNFMGKAVFKNAIYKKEWFTPTIYTPFENVELKIPQNIQDFLTFRFGDYMRPPSLNRIKWEQHAEMWDCNKDFREVCPQCKEPYSDEANLI